MSTADDRQMPEVRDAIKATRDSNELRAKAACRLVDVWRARAEQAEATLAHLQESLRDPTVAHIALLRGDIARPSEGNLRHLYPEWGQAEQRAEKAEVRLARVRELPDRWDCEVADYLTSTDDRAMYAATAVMQMCAQELRDALAPASTQEDQ